MTIKFDDETKDIEKELVSGIGEKLAKDKMPLIKIIASRMAEERALTRELHEKYMSVFEDDAFQKRDSLLKRIEALSRIVVSTWKELGITSQEEDNEMLGFINKNLEKGD